MKKTLFTAAFFCAVVLNAGAQTDAQPATAPGVGIQPVQAAPLEVINPDGSVAPAEPAVAAEPKQAAKKRGTTAKVLKDPPPQATEKKAAAPSTTDSKPAQVQIVPVEAGNPDGSVAPPAPAAEPKQAAKKRGTTAKVLKDPAPQPAEKKAAAPKTGSK